MQPGDDRAQLGQVINPKRQMREAVRRTIIGAPRDHSELMMLLGRLAQKYNLTVISADRSPVGYLETKDMGVKVNHSGVVLDMQHGVRPGKCHGNSPLCDISCQFHQTFPDRTVSR
jgi:hypothetical protein